MRQDIHKAQLLTELAADRRRLVSTVHTLSREDLGLPTRNPGWTVHHVLAHVLSDDADLIAYLKMSLAEPANAKPPNVAEHNAEMGICLVSGPKTLHHELETRGASWGRLLAKTPPSHWSNVAAFVNQWRGHDTVHNEDVRLAVGRNVK